MTFEIEERKTEIIFNNNTYPIFHLSILTKLDIARIESIRLLCTDVALITTKISSERHRKVRQTKSMNDRREFQLVLSICQKWNKYDKAI